METTKLIILLCCAYNSIASNFHTIPVEGYDSELQVLGQHVEIPKTPVKVIKITKTIAVKVPVPYPVKVIQKVPYPVHVSKPYPVPVPQIIKVPHVVQVPAGHQPAPVEASSYPDSQSYSVQENGLPEDHIRAKAGHEQSYGTSADAHSPEGQISNSYEAPTQNYFGYANSKDDSSFETKSYDDALKQYFSEKQAGGNNYGEGANQYNY